MPNKPVDWAHFKGIMYCLMYRLREDGGNVLVVEDDADTRDRLRAVHEKSGWRFREGANGSRRSGVSPKLCLLDLTMPVIGGFSFLHRLRRAPGCADIPVVVLRARDITSAEQEQFNDAGQILSKGDTSIRDFTAELRKLEGRLRWIARVSASKQIAKPPKRRELAQGRLAALGRKESVCCR